MDLQPGSGRHRPVLIMVTILISVLAGGCDLITSLGTREVRIRNMYNAPVSITIYGYGSQTIPAYGYTELQLPRRDVTITAVGTYFERYREVLDEYDRYLGLEADRGWVFLENNSSFTLFYPKYGYKAFSYDEDLNPTYVTAVLPGSKIGIPIYEEIHSPRDITFSVSGSLTRYKVSRPLYGSVRIGWTHTCRITDYTGIEETW